MKIITITGVIKGGRRVELPIGNMPIYKFEILCNKGGYKFPVGVYRESDIDKVTTAINKGEKMIEVELASFFRNGQHIITMKLLRFKGDFNSYVMSAMYDDENSQIS